METLNVADQQPRVADQQPRVADQQLHVADQQLHVQEQVHVRKCIHAYIHTYILTYILTRKLQLWKNERHIHTTSHHPHIDFTTLHSYVHTYIFYTHTNMYIHKFKCTCIGTYVHKYIRPSAHRHGKLRLRAVARRFGQSAPVQDRTGYIPHV